MRCVNCRLFCSPRRIRNIIILSLTTALVVNYILISTNEKIVIRKNITRSNDLTKVYTKLRTKVTCLAKLKLLILVSSNLGHSDRRYLIRKTWGPDNSLIMRWRTVFLLTENDNKLEKRRADIESDLYGDLITGNYKEAFFNMAFKVAMGFEWALKFCKFDYLLKTDDDIFVNTHGLMDYLNLDSTLKAKLYTGNPMVGSVVLRKGRYAVKYAGKEPRDDATNKTVFDPYCSGGGFLLSCDVVSSLLNLYDLNHPLNIDDAYIGELALRAGVKPLINPKNFKMYENKCRYDPTAFVQHPAKGDCLLELHRKHAKYLLTGELETPKPTPPPTKPPTPLPRLSPPPAPKPQLQKKQGTKKTATILRDQNQKTTKKIIEQKPTPTPPETLRQNSEGPKSSDKILRTIPTPTQHLQKPNPHGVNPTLAPNSLGLKSSEKIPGRNHSPSPGPQLIPKQNSQGLKSPEKIPGKNHSPSPGPQLIPKQNSQGLKSPEKIPGRNKSPAETSQLLPEQNSQRLKSSEKIPGRNHSPAPGPLLIPEQNSQGLKS